MLQFAAQKTREHLDEPTGSLGAEHGKPDFRALRALPGGRFQVFVASLGLNILALALPIVLLQTYDRIIPNNSRDTLALLVAGVVCALLLDAMLRLGRSYVTGWAAARFEHRIGCQSVGWLLNAKLASFEEEAPGGYLDRLMSLGTVRDFYSGQAMLVLVDLPFAIVFLGLITYLAGALVLVPLAILALFSLGAWHSGAALRTAIVARSAVDDRRYNFIIEVLTGIHTIKALGMEALMTRRYERLQESCAGAGYAVNQCSGQAQTLGALFSQLTMVAVASVGSLVVIDGGLSVGGLAACSLLAGRSLQPLLKAMGIWTQFQNIRIARARVQSIFDVTPESPQVLAPMPEISGAIEFENLRFAYDNHGPPLFDGMNLKVAPGEFIGICGDNGSGKSTLLWLMMGLIKPESGRVLFDGHAAEDYDSVSLRRQIGYMPQHGVLFQGTILENLTSFGGDELIEQAYEAAVQLGLDEVVARMPLGYQSRVGESASDSVPGGVKQRIAIARALVGQPKLLLFDEANSSLDGPGDLLVRHLLENMRGERTIILVSHRPSMLKLADRIYDIRGGQFVQRPELAAADGNPVVQMQLSA